MLAKCNSRCVLRRALRDSSLSGAGLHDIRSKEIERVSIVPALTHRLSLVSVFVNAAVGGSLLPARCRFGRWRSYRASFPGNQRKQAHYVPIFLIQRFALGGVQKDLAGLPQGYAVQDTPEE